jgi:hypothetical protein
MEEKEPIMIPCEGSYQPTHFNLNGMCKMCGAQTGASPAPPHYREDILAMIERGDFG